MLQERNTGLAVIVFVNLPAAVSTFILAICGCTEEQEGLGGVELADGCALASPAQTPDPPVQLTWVALMSTAIELSLYRVSGLAVCVPTPAPAALFPPSKPVRKSSACSGPVLEAQHVAAQLIQASHCPCLPTTKTVGEYFMVTTCKESHRPAREKTSWKTKPTFAIGCKTIRRR